MTFKAELSIEKLECLKGYTYQGRFAVIASKENIKLRTVKDYPHYENSFKNDWQFTLTSSRTSQSRL